MHFLKDKNIQQIRVMGGNYLDGIVIVPGDKVSAMHLLLASLVVDTCVEISKFPFCGDPLTLIEWMTSRQFTNCSFRSGSILVEPSEKRIFELPPHMRATICLTTALTLKYGEIYLPKVGGCDFTFRPIDRHLDLIKAFGMEFRESINGTKIMYSKNQLPKQIVFDCSTKYGPSVGVTCHALISSLQYKGKMSLKNVALEPVVHSLVQFVKQATNRKIQLNGRTLTLEKIPFLEHNKIRINLLGDLTVAFTYIAAAMACGGKILLNGLSHFPKYLSGIVDQVGVSYDFGDNAVKVDVSRVKFPQYIECKPYPGFSTDMGPIIIAGLAPHSGSTKLIDYVYNSRASHVKGLQAMGYDVTSKKNIIYVKGRQPSNNHVKVNAPDIRAGASLFVGALARPASTIITNYPQIFRGYPNLISDFQSLGALIEII